MKNFIPMRNYFHEGLDLQQYCESFNHILYLKLSKKKLKLFYFYVKFYPAFCSHLNNVEQITNWSKVNNYLK